MAAQHTALELSITADVKALRTAIQKIGETAVTPLQRNLNKGMESVKKNIDALSALKNKTVSTYGDIARLQRDLFQASKIKVSFDTKRAVEEIGALKGKIIASVAGLYGVVAKPLRSAANFEKDMIGVAKVLSLSNEEIATFGEEIINLSKKIPKTTSELAGLAEQMAQMGIAKEEVIKATEVASKMASAFGSNASEVGKAMGALKAGFGISVLEIQKTGDAINELSNIVSQGAPVILDATTRIAPIAKTLGLSSIEAAALSAALVDLGNSSELAASGLKDLLLDLSTVHTKSASAKAAFARLGLDGDEFKKTMETNAMEGIEVFLSALRNKSKGEQVSIAKEIFGAQHIDKIIGLASNVNLEKIKKVVASKSYLGSMEEEFKRVVSSFNEQMVLLGNNTGALVTKIGSALLPTATGFVKYIAKAFGELARFWDDHPELMKWLAYLGGGIATAIAAFSAFGVLLTSFKIIFAPFVSGLKAIHAGAVFAARAFTTAAVAARALSLTLRSALIATGIGGVVLALSSLAVEWEAVWNSLKGPVDVCINYVQSAWEGFKERWFSFLGSIKQAWEGVWNKIEAVKSKLGFGSSKADANVMVGSAAPAVSNNSSLVNSNNNVTQYITINSPSEGQMDKYFGKKSTFADVEFTNAP